MEVRVSDLRRNKLLGNRGPWVMFKEDHQDSGAELRLCSCSMDFCSDWMDALEDSKAAAGFLQQPTHKDDICRVNSGTSCKHVILRPFNWTVEQTRAVTHWRSSPGGCLMSYKPHLIFHIRTGEEEAALMISDVTSRRTSARSCCYWWRNVPSFLCPHHHCLRHAEGPLPRWCFTFCRALAECAPPPGRGEGCFFFFILTHLVNGVLLGEVPEPFTQGSRTSCDFIYSCHSKGRRASRQANINVEVWLSTHIIRNDLSNVS